MGQDRRRADESRMKAKAVRRAISLYKSVVIKGRDFLDPRSVGRIYSTHGSECSCAMCGNPRRHFGTKSRQEIRFDLNDPDE